MDSDTDKTVAWNSIIPSLLTAPPSGADHASSNVLPNGIRLGEFEIIDVIGEGGFGIVYHAYDHSLERHVALKEYMPSGLASRSRTLVVTVKSQVHMETFEVGLKSFINEARLLAQFDAPSLVKVFQFWEANSTAYMVMPYYEGVTLKQAMQTIKASPSEDWIRSFLANLIDAIEIIHRVNCYHRDIAPDNILLLKNGRPLLLDFGAARRVIGDRTQGPTAILKPGFAPMEQYADIPGLKQGPWTDIYALGAVVYYLISGKTPVAAVSRMINDTLVPAQEVGRGRFSAAFLAVVDRALAVRPENRIQTIAEFRGALAIGDDVPRTLPPLQQGGMKRIEPRLNARVDRDEPASAEPDPDKTMISRPPAATAAPAAPAPPPGPGTRADAAQRRSGIPGGKPAIAAVAALLVMAAGGAVFMSSNRDTAAKAPTASASDTGGEKAAAATSKTAAETARPPTGAASVATAPASVVPASVAPPSAAPPSTTPPAAPQPAMTQPVAPPAIATAQKSPQPPAAAMSLEVQPREAPSSSAEEQQWLRATAADDGAAYREYLRAYPKGRFATTAKAAVERLQQKAQPVAAASSTTSAAPIAGAARVQDADASARDEDIAWHSAQAMDVASSYETFLNKYTAGRYAGAARSRLAELSAKAKANATPNANAAGAVKPQEKQPAEQVVAKAAAPAEAAKASREVEEPRTAPVQDMGARPNASETVSAPVKASAPPAVASSGRKPIRIANQTMIGDFTMDPITGAVSGRGKIVWDSGDQFDGTLVRGVKEGKGEFVWANGQRYKGDWAKGLPNGRGSIEFANGNKYNGDMRDGVPNGKGTMVFGNGNRYSGEVKDGLPNGRGTTRFSNGDVYNGAWRDGKSNGRGRYTWADGTYWEGEFVDDRKTENGKLVRASADSGATPPATPSERDNADAENVAEQK